MNKKILSFFVTILLLITIFGCDGYFFNTENDKSEIVITTKITVVEYRVNYYIDGVLRYYATNHENQKIKKPDDPVKDNHTFLGWYTNDGKLYDFNSPLSSSFNLYAKFQMDYTKILNLLSTEYISTNVKVQVKHWNTGFLGIFEKDVIQSTGSGVIFADSDGYYYVLTNNHVVFDKDRENHEYKIQDYKGNVYSAKLYNNSADANYDLAILFFTKGSEKLKVSKLAKDNPIINEEIISIGQPDGQNNAITFGVVEIYKTVTLINTPVGESNVQFKVIKHSAPISSGSSGGVLMNSNFEIVGINYAGEANTSFSDSSYGLSIPVEKIKEYFNLYVNQK